MKNSIFAVLLLAFFVACDQETDPIVENESDFSLSTCVNIDFDTSCSGPTLFDSTPFITTQFVSNIEGWIFDTIDCISPINKCFGVQLRRNIIREFGKHTNNVSCGLKGTPCPPSGYEEVECYNNYDGIFLDLEDFAGVDISDGLQTNEADLIYQEFMCRILNDTDTADSEYIVIDNMHMEACLCGSSTPRLTYTMKVFREI